MSASSLIPLEDVAKAIKETNFDKGLGPDSFDGNVLLKSSELHDKFCADIAIALNAWCFEADGSFNVTSARALVAGYEARRPLSPAERAALPVLARGAAMRFFLTRLADWGSVPEGALVQPKSPMEYERKLAVHRESTDLLLFGPGA